MEGLKAAWLDAGFGEQQRIARDIQVLALHDVPYYPIGQYLQPTAYRARLDGIMDGTAVFWGVKAG